MNYSHSRQPKAASVRPEIDKGRIEELEPGGHLQSDAGDTWAFVLTGAIACDPGRHGAGSLFPVTSGTTFTKTYV